MVPKTGIEPVREVSLWYESQWEYTTTETITTTQEVEGDNAEINNVEGNQYKDNSVHNEGGSE